MDCQGRSIIIEYCNRFDHLPQSAAFLVSWSKTQREPFGNKVAVFFGNHHSERDGYIVNAKVFPNGTLGPTPARDHYEHIHGPNRFTAASVQHGCADRVVRDVGKNH